MVLLNQERFESPLPQSPGRLVFRVMPAHVRGESPLHPPAEIFGASWTHYEMKMIRHQACREDRHVDPLLRQMDEREELLIVRGSVEYPRLLVAPIQDVVAVIRDDEAIRPWHAFKLDQWSRSRRAQIRGEYPIRNWLPVRAASGLSPFAR